MDRLKNIPLILPVALRVGGVIELATGCALIAVPSVVIQALSGSSSDQAGWIVGRVLGGALLALGVAAMFPGSTSPDRGVTLAFVVYNTSTALVLVVAGATGRADGLLLWPAAGVHAILAAALVVGSFRVGRAH